MRKKKTPAAPTLANLALAASSLIEQAASLGARRGYAQAIAVLEVAAASDEHVAPALMQALEILKEQAPR